MMMQNGLQDKFRIMTLIQDGISHSGMCVSNLAFQVACEMGLEPEICHELAVAGVVHDIGKLEISKYLYSRINSE